MSEQMAIEIIKAFESGAELVALNADNSAWKTGGYWGEDWSAVDFDEFCEILEDEGLGELVG